MSRLRISMLCIYAALCVALLVPAQFGWCAEAKERYIKKLGVSDGYINLEVDGEKIGIPLPEGYEIYRKEDYPENYENNYGPTRSKLAIQLAGLVNSQDHAIRQKNSGHLLTPVRFAFIDIEKVYALHRLSLSEFRTEIGHLKNNSRILAEKNKGTPKDIFIYSYIVDNGKTLSELRVKKKDSTATNVAMAYTKSYTILEKIVFSIRFYTLDGIHDPINSLVLDTKKYISLIEKQ